MIKKIVLTGGPCAGKSTALSKIENYLLEKGYAVLIVAESATELIKSGIRPFGNQALYGFDFQGVILDYQLNKEKTYEQAANLLEASGRDVIILYDRGAVDNKAYLDISGWQQLLKNRNIQENDLKANYDLVIHMVTAALGAEEAYTLQNNQARTETIEEARDLDNKTLQAWNGHTNLRIIDNDCSFDEKIEKVLDECLKLLENKVLIREQRKYLVDSENINLEGFCTKSTIHQFYFQKENSSYEYRVRKQEIEGKNYYSLTVQEKLENGKSRLIKERKISTNEYLNYLENENFVSSIKKTRYTFLYEKEYIRLDIFEDGNIILEIEPMSNSKDIIIPPGITVLKEVSNDTFYQNCHLAKVKALN